MLISVIITTRNEEANIKNCLDSILDQNYPKDKIEIIVVDNNSTDKTIKIAESFRERFTPLNLKVFNWGPERSAQRNFGVEKSSGEFFLYLDADMILDKNVIRDCVELIQSKNKKLQTENLIALYISEIVMGEKFWSKVRRFERSFYDGTVIDCVRFVKKEAFQKVGGFDENLTGPEDWDFDKKIRNLRNDGGACPDDCSNNLFGVALIKTPIYHNEAEFNLKNYLNKKGYYAQKFDEYIAKWGVQDPDIKKQFGIYYRFLEVFVEKGKWKKMLAHPILISGVYFLRIMVGVKFLLR
ncbi:MAG: glycosyl transferase [Candidatus Moranbacteria bacterium CG_4_9_14_3_um_filter_36_9]|nr:MAG: glycosyl transferase [Candidatus Moranbacteria bacterium CG_4_9_14_3_um_filter_36_9]